VSSGFSAALSDEIGAKVWRIFESFRCMLEWIVKGEFFKIFRQQEQAGSEGRRITQLPKAMAIKVRVQSSWSSTIFRMLLS
jgi:hypothetical protein